MKLHIVKTEEPHEGLNGPGKLIKFFVNGALVATCRVYNEYFCSVLKDGTISPVRDKLKKAKSTFWNKTGLGIVLGHENFTIGDPVTPSGIFIDSYPITQWINSRGHIPSKAEIKKKIKLALNTL